MAWCTQMQTLFVGCHGCACWFRFQTSEAAQSGRGVGGKLGVGARPGWRAEGQKIGRGQKVCGTMFSFELFEFNKMFLSFFWVFLSFFWVFLKVLLSFFELKMSRGRAEPAGGPPPAEGLCPPREKTGKRAIICTLRTPRCKTMGQVWGAGLRAHDHGFSGDRYDWTTGAPDNGNDWRKFRVVPRSHPLRPLVLYFV